MIVEGNIAGIVELGKDGMILRIERSWDLNWFIVGQASIVWDILLAIQTIHSNLNKLT